MFTAAGTVTIGFTVIAWQGQWPMAWSKIIAAIGQYYTAQYNHLRWFIYDKWMNCLSTYIDV